MIDTIEGSREKNRMEKKEIAYLFRNEEPVNITVKNSRTAKSVLIYCYGIR